MSEELPWVKWHFAKWRTDPGLRMCGLAARGLWKELLCIMAECQPYGHLLVNGRGLSNAQIASMVGMTSEREVGRLLAELDDAGVFSRTPEGAIYSRRLVRDKHARDLGRAYGKAGGNPALTGKGKTPEQEDGVKGGVNPKANPTPLPREEREEKREKEEEKKEASPSAQAARARIDLPAWLPAEPWRAFLEMRQTMKKPPTPHAVALLVKKLDGFRARGFNVAEILNSSTLNGWQDVFEPKASRGHAAFAGRATNLSLYIEPDPEWETT